jgi:hypothetical protein
LGLISRGLELADELKLGWHFFLLALPLWAYG